MILLLLLACAEVAQTPACASFVACVAARDAEQGATTDVLRFEPSGACWGSPAGADLCDRSCENGLAWLRDTEPNPPEACER